MHCLCLLMNPKRTSAIVDRTRTHPLRGLRCLVLGNRQPAARCASLVVIRQGAQRRRRRRRRKDGPCISASVRGASFARPRMVASHVRVEATEYLNRSSAAIAGPTTSPSRQRRAVAELGEQVAAQQGAGRLLVSSRRRPSHAAYAACRCSAPACRAPSSITSPSGSTRGARSAMSLSDTRQPVWPCATSALGATASHSFIAPHSSAS